MAEVTPSEGAFRSRESVIFGWKKRKGNFASESTGINSLEVRRKEVNSRHDEVTVQWKWSYLYSKMGGYEYLRAIRTIMSL